MSYVDKLRVMQRQDILSFLRLRLDGPLRIQASREMIEFFRAQMGDPVAGNAICPLSYDLPGVSIFEVEQTPYRTNGINCVAPSIEVLNADGVTRKFQINPEWVGAPFELVIGYGVGCLQVVTFKR